MDKRLAKMTPEQAFKLGRERGRAEGQRQTLAAVQRALSEACAANWMSAAMQVRALVAIRRWAGIRVGAPS